MALYTRELADSRNGPCGPIRVESLDYEYDPKDTLYTNLQRGAAMQDGQRILYGTRPIDPATGVAGPYKWMTYAQVIDTSAWIATAMATTLKIQRQECVALFAKNCVEWCLIEHACSRMAYTLVPLYDALGKQAVPFILNHAEIRVAFVAADQVATVLAGADQCPRLQMVVVLPDPMETDGKRSVEQQAAEQKIELRRFEDLLAQVKQANMEPVAPDCPTSQDMATICYTSGTTGNPKGVVLTHRNMMAATMTIAPRLPMDETDVYLSYLPLAHVLERIAHMNAIRISGRIGFYQGKTAKLLDDLQELKPTVFISVPRLLNRVFDKIQMGVQNASGIQRFLFQRAFQSKLYHLENGNRMHHWLWDALVFRKLRALLGGRVKYIVSGSAPISHETKQFLSIVFSCPVVEGYGLTECVGSAAVARVDMPMGTNVGIPYVGVQVRLLDVPEMNYTNDDNPRPRGEVLIKGDCVFAGYYKDPKQTAMVLDADGWLHTGDIGAWNPDGTLSIIDRKKNIFKLSQGEYVAPEKIENVYIKSAMVQQVFVHGDSLKSYLVGVVVPEVEVVAKWAREQGLCDAHADDNEAYAEACAQKQLLVSAILSDMHRVGKENGLFGFEQPKCVHVHPEPFSVEQGLVTPTFKLKRAQLRAHFKQEINAMYETPSEAVARVA